LGKRRKAREIVLQSLYEAEFSDSTWEEILAGHTGRRASTGETVEYARALLSKTIENKEHLDEVIQSVLQNWEMGRISLIDKNILRFALCEILYFPEIPPKVIVNEAIEVAHRFSSHDAGKFVNGILDRFLQQYRRDSD
jgi:N utilization substance protein B